MAFRRVEVSDFQSIHHADVELGVRDGGGGITTIVGPSSTGKSALLRAVRMLARNQSSVPVRSGAKKATVKVTSDTSVVEADRGKALSTYRVDGEVFAKAGVSVPDAATKALGLREDTPDPHFSFQFDSPYLLAVPGSKVSDVIGSLTHANVLRAAVREGARRAQNAKQEKAIRTKDAQALAQQIVERFADLPEREAAFEEARERVLEATKASDRADTLATLLEGWEAASTGLETVSSTQRRYEDVFPLVDAAHDAFLRLNEIENIVSALTQAVSMKATQDWLVAACAKAAEEADGEYNKLLVEAGMCPTCGQVTA